MDMSLMMKKKMKKKEEKSVDEDIGSLFKEEDEK